jgi:hypothetical protein
VDDEPGEEAADHGGDHEHHEGTLHPLDPCVLRLSAMFWGMLGVSGGKVNSRIFKPVVWV